MGERTGVPVRLEVAGATDIGGRSENQDTRAHRRTADGAFLLLCDGMGGHAGGGVAARLFTEAMVTAASAAATDAGTGVPDPEAVADMIRAAAAVMAEGARRLDPYLDPHTTAVMAWLGGRRTVVAHVGDSRLYHLDRYGVRWRTRDHSHVQMMVEAGELDPEAAAHHPYRNLVLRSVGGALPPEPEVAVRPALGPGEAVVLCSDGLWEHVPEAELAQLAGVGDWEAALAGLVRLAVARGGTRADNATVLAARRPAR
jgi:serine/threonine protein phosphatase PrpC